MKRVTARLVLPLLLILGGCAGEQATTEPASVRQTPSSEGHSIEYSVHGDGPLGIVLIHGWLEDRSFWRQQIPVLAEHQTVIAIDLLGHGGSAAQRTDRSSWSIDAFAKDLIAVVEQIPNEQLVLVGHSMGGQVALAAAPRLHSRVLGVVGVDSLHNAEMVVSAEGWDPIMALYREDFAATCQRFVGSMFPHATEDPNLPEWVRGKMCGSNPEVAIAVAERFPLIDQRALFQAAQLPIRCINSPLTLPTEAEINRRYADYDVRSVDGAGHFLMLERPTEFNLLLAETIEELTGS